MPGQVSERAISTRVIILERAVLMQHSTVLKKEKTFVFCLTLCLTRRASRAASSADHRMAVVARLISQLQLAATHAPGCQ